jgi:hypothetical protein
VVVLTYARSLSLETARRVGQIVMAAVS